MENHKFIDINIENVEVVKNIRMLYIYFNHKFRDLNLENGD